MDTGTAKQSANKRPRGGDEGRPSEGGILDGRTRRARRRRELIATFSNDLGGDAVLTEGQRIGVRKAAELTALAEDARALSLQEGPGNVGATSVMVRLQSASERAIRMLGLPPAGATAAPVNGLHGIVAKHAGDG